MTKENAPTSKVSMNVLAQFITDMSFENIIAQKGIKGEVSPDVQVKVDLNAKKRSIEDQYEVLIKLQIDSKSRKNSEQLFLLELDYAGIFQVSGIPREQLHPFLLIECPRMLFPFLRRIVSDITRDGGFPPLNLENIDFVELYKSEVARRKESTAHNTNHSDDSAVIVE